MGIYERPPGKMEYEDNERNRNWGFRSPFPLEIDGFELSPGDKAAIVGRFEDQRPLSGEEKKALLDFVDFLLKEKLMFHTFAYVWCGNDREKVPDYYNNKNGALTYVYVDSMGAPGSGEEE